MDQFIPHMKAYFNRDKQDKYITYRITFVEQEEGALFNRGLLKNIGYELTRNDFDYFCFHDIDYLPIWADYSYPEKPSRLCWYGADRKSVAPGGPKTIVHDHDSFFGAVVLFQKEHFERVRGFSNQYEGWGFEDSDLRMRCLAAGLGIELRDGTYLSLEHENQGLNQDLSFNKEGSRNREIFQREHMARNESGTEKLQADGLDDLQFTILERRCLTSDGSENMEPNIEKVTVRFASALTDL